MVYTAKRTENGKYIVTDTGGRGCRCGVGPMNQGASAQSGAAANSADDYPNKPIRVVVASAPGGGTDIIGRIVVQGLSEIWPQHAIVDNRGGSAGTIATGIVVKSASDGYTLQVQGLGVSYAGALRKNLPFRRNQKSAGAWPGSAWKRSAEPGTVCQVFSLGSR